MECAVGVVLLGVSFTADVVDLKDGGLVIGPVNVNRMVDREGVALNFVVEFLGERLEEFAQLVGVRLCCRSFVRLRGSRRHFDECKYWSRH